MVGRQRARFPSPLLDRSSLFYYFTNEHFRKAGHNLRHRLRYLLTQRLLDHLSDSLFRERMSAIGFKPVILGRAKVVHEDLEIVLGLALPRQLGRVVVISHSRQQLVFTVSIFISTRHPRRNALSLGRALSPGRRVDYNSREVYHAPCF